MQTRTLFRSDSSGTETWEITWDSHEVEVWWQSGGREFTRRHPFASEALATRFAEAQITERRAQGFVEEPPPVPAERVDETLQALWQAAQAAPDDPGPTLVLADWLQHHDDPIGILIATADAPGRAQQQRHLSLRQSYASFLFGALDDLEALDVTWARGFVRRLHLGAHPAPTRPADEGALARVLRHPCLQLLHTLVLDSPHDAHPQRVIDALTESGPFPTLRRLVLRSQSHVEFVMNDTLWAAAPGLTHLTIVGSPQYGTPLPAGLEHLGLICRRSPDESAALGEARLRTLAVLHDRSALALHELLSARGCARLEHLWLLGNPFTPDALARDLPARQTLRQVCFTAARPRHLRQPETVYQGVRRRLPNHITLAPAIEPPPPWEDDLLPWDLFDDDGDGPTLLPIPVVDPNAVQIVEYQDDPYDDDD